jgi:hypothetical protein
MVKDDIDCWKVCRKELDQPESSRFVKIEEWKCWRSKSIESRRFGEEEKGLMDGDEGDFYI